jgi:hypothetical protein
MFHSEGTTMHQNPSGVSFIQIHCVFSYGFPTMQNIEAYK